MIWFGMVGRMDPGMRQVLWFGIGPREGVILGRMWDAPLMSRYAMRKLLPWNFSLIQWKWQMAIKTEKIVVIAVI